MHKEPEVYDCVESAYLERDLPIRWEMSPLADLWHLSPVQVVLGNSRVYLYDYSLEERVQDG